MSIAIASAQKEADASKYQKTIAIATAKETIFIASVQTYEEASLQRWRS